MTLIFGLFGRGAGAQTTGSGSFDDARYELGFHLGSLLPSQIDGVTEIMGLGGVRGGLMISQGTYFEGGMIFGNGSGQKWKNLHADLRMDVPVENLVGLAYIGADSTYYKGVNASSRLIFGGHVGAGLRTQITGLTWFRSDMKFSFSPGSSLYIGFGFEFRIK